MSKQGAKNTQLTSAKKYNVENMIFSDPVEGKIEGDGPIIKFCRVNISTKNPDGSVGELVIPTERLFSYGVQENCDRETKKINGYVLPLCLWDREKPTKEQKEFTTTFDNIVNHCKKHIIANREEIGKYELEMSDLKKFNPLYWKKEKGKVVPGTGPTLYAKLIYSKKHKKIVTTFFGPDGETVDPMDDKAIFGRYCWATGAVKIESIFVGNTISLQVKLYEAEVEPMESGIKPLLKRPQAKPRSLIQTKKKTVDLNESDDDLNASGGDEEGSDVGSLNDSGDEDEKEKSATPPPKKKPVVKRKVRKAGK